MQKNLSIMLLSIIVYFCQFKVCVDLCLPNLVYETESRRAMDFFDRANSRGNTTSLRAKKKTSCGYTTNVLNCSY